MFMPTFTYRPGTEVFIKALNTEARVISASIDEDGGVMYQISYWYDGERRVHNVRPDEIRPT